MVILVSVGTPVLNTEGTVRLFVEGIDSLVQDLRLNRQLNCS